MNNNNIQEKKPPQEPAELILSELMAKNPKKCHEIVSAFNYKLRQSFQNVKVEDYFNNFEIVDNWINNCFDDIRNYVKVISYPLFIHLFIDMIIKGQWTHGIFYFINTYS